MDTQEILQRLNYNTENPTNKKCVVCGVPIPSGKRVDSCSRSHGSKLSHLVRGIRFDKVCPVCGKEFQVTSRERNSQTACSKDCEYIRRSGYMSKEGNHQYGLKGELNSSYTVGRRIDTHGYVRVLDHNHPNADAQGYVKEHIKVMSEHLGEPINTSTHVVHHIDEDRENNDLSNLEMMTKGEHTRLHNKDLEIERDDQGRFVKVVKIT